jgi:Dirigent-like protein
VTVKWAALAAVVAGLIVLPAQAAPHVDSAARTIRLVSTNGTVKVLVDKAPKGQPGKGDVVQERTTLRNAVAQFGKAKGAVVGSDASIYTFLSPTVVNMKVTAKLPGGTLRSTARIEGSTLPALKVVGGTGAFAGARGTGQVKKAPAGVNGVLNIYRLQLP